MSEQKQQMSQSGGQPGQQTAKRKPFLRRYGAFFILLAAGVAAGFALPDIGQKALTNTLSSVREMLSVLPPIFILLGLLDVWVDRTTMMSSPARARA